MVCFDCIGIKVEDLVCSLTAGVPDGSSKDLNLLFVIEHNDHPEHPEFMSFAEKLLSDPPKLHTGLSGSVAFVNSANRDHGRAKQEEYGRSAIYYYRRGNWSGCGDNGPLTVIPNTFALENSANTLVRTRFREDGPSRRQNPVHRVPRRRMDPRLRNAAAQDHADSARRVVGHRSRAWPPRRSRNRNGRNVLGAR